MRYQVSPRRVRKEAFVNRVAGWVRELPFMWPVLPDYEIVAVKGEQGPVTLIRGVKRGAAQPRWYAPLRDTPGLFWDFAHLGEKLGGVGEDRAKVEELALTWVRRYGLLGTAYVPAVVHSPDGARQALPNAEPLEEFVAYARRAYAFLSLYELVRANDTQGLRERVRVTPSAGLFYSLEVDGEPVPFGTFYSKNRPELDSENLEAGALVHLIWRLAGYLRYISPTVERIEPRRVHGRRTWDIVRTWNPGNLLTCMMFQFYLYLTGKERSGFCTNCGEPFPLTKLDRMLCDRCLKNNAAQVDYYHRKKRIVELCRQGYSAAQIREMVPRARLKTIEKIMAQEGVPSGK